MANASIRLHFALDGMLDDLFTPFTTDVGPFAQNLFLKVARRFQDAAIIPTSERFRAKANPGSPLPPW